MFFSFIETEEIEGLSNLAVPPVRLRIISSAEILDVVVVSTKIKSLKVKSTVALSSVSSISVKTGTSLSISKLLVEVYELAFPALSSATIVTNAELFMPEGIFRS